MVSTLVTTVDEVVDNVLRLHAFGFGSTEERRFHDGRVKNGKRFIAYLEGDAGIFCPSKFAGYRDNDLSHAKLLHERHGTTTSSRITRLLGEPLQPNDRGYASADRRFLSYCRGFGIAPTRWDRPRTYWIVRASRRHEESEKASADRDYAEGGLVSVLSNRYERDARARTECIRHYGSSCVVCGINFAKAYGGLGTGFIHVHHLTPLSQIRSKYKVDPIKDLRPVCPNCHAMLHWGSANPLSIQDLKCKIAK
jgi:5-methylcytosine-specific restriction protein A